MAVTAKFVADFSSFTQAVERAETKLRSFESGAASVGRALDRMGDSFSGRKLLQDATLAAKAVEDLGGASKLTETEQKRLNSTVTEALAKYKALGIEAPASLHKLQAETTQQKSLFERMTTALGPLGPMIAATFSVTAVVNFGLALLADADALTKMADRTGITTTGLQRLQIAGDDAGNTIDQMTGAVNQMQNRLAEGDDSAVGALRKLHINLEQFQSLRPDQQFIRISDAIREIEDPAAQVSLAMDLFGRQGAEILPTLKRGFDDIGESAVGMSEKTVKALDDAGDAWGRWWRAAKGITAEAIVGFAKLATANVGYAATQQKAADEAKAYDDALQKAIDTSGKMLQMGNPLKAIQPPSKSEMNEIIRNLDAQREKLNASTRAAEELRRVTDRAFGLDKIDQAKEMVRAIGGLSGVSKMAADQQAALNKLMTEAIDAAKRNGNVASIEWYRIANATAAAIDQVKLLGNEYVKAGEKLEDGLLAPLARLDAKPMNIPANYDLNAKPSGASGDGGLGGVINNAKSGLKDIFSATNLVNGIVTGGLQQIGSLITGLIGKGLGKVAGWIKDILGPSDAYKVVQATGDWERANAKVIAQMQQSTNVSKDVKAAYDAVYNTRRVEDFQSAVGNLDEVYQEFLAGQEADAQRLTAAIEKYKFSIEELGPAFKQQELDKQAKELIEDWRVLVGAGADISIVNTRMAETINDYLTTATKVGVEIPNAMKPILQSMIDQGKLVDANGVAITNLEQTGVTFSETMTQGFDRVVVKLEELISKLQATGSAINNIPRSIDISANYSAPQLPTFDPSQFETPSYFHAGGMVRKAHRGMLANDEVPIIAQAGEAILSRKAVSMIGGPQAVSNLNSGGGSGQPIVIEVPVTLDGARVARVVARHLPNELGRMGIKAA